MNVPAEVAKAIRQSNDLFESELVAKRNIQAIDLIYTTHAHVLPPGAEMIAGREQIKGFWKQAIEGLDVQSVKLTTIDMEALGDGVVEIGRGELSLSGGGSVTIKYFVQWKQEDGRWKIHVDIWNANQ
jgi:ketosteroid isomerase-like protein